MGFSRSFLAVILLNSVGFAAENGATCSDTIRIEGSPSETKKLRALLQRGVLVETPSVVCKNYRVKLTGADSNGWSLTMTDTVSGAHRQRKVTSLAYAATWLEAWSQSGFAPLADEPDDDSKSKPQLEPPRAAALSSLPSEPVNQPFILGGGPIGLVSSRGYGLMGGGFHAEHRARRGPSLGGQLVVARQFTPENVAYRMVYWMGPSLGLAVPLDNHWSLVPAVSVGLLGSTAKTTVPATTLGGYFGIRTDIEHRFSSMLSLFAGVDFVFAAPTLLGAAPSSSSDDSESESEDELESESEQIVDPVVGSIIVGFRLGLDWDFGGAS